MILTPSGATTYTFMPGNITGSSATVSPVTTANYTVNGESSGCIGTDASATVSVSICDQIDAMNAGPQFQLYPNPVQNVLTITFDEIFHGEIIVCNAIGQLISTKKIYDIKTLDLDLSAFPEGVYLLSVRDNTTHKIRSTKVVKQ